MYNLWRNKKNGRLYHVMFLSKHCTNGKEHETIVQYTRDGEYYARELSEFLVKFTPTVYSEKMGNLQKASDFPYTAKLNDEFLKQFEEGYSGEMITEPPKTNSGFLSKRIKQLPNNREVLEMPNSVNFIMVTKDEKVILASQKRAGNSELETLNCFGGYIEKGDDAKSTLFKEMFEESNVTKEDVQNVLTVYEGKKVSVGYTTEESNLYVVDLNKNSYELDLKCNDKNESISIKLVDLRTTDDIEEIYSKTNCLKFHAGLSFLFTWMRITEETRCK